MPPPDGTLHHPKAANCFADAPPIPPKQLHAEENEYVPAGFQRLKSHTLPVGPLPTARAWPVLRMFGITGAATKTLIAGIAYCTASVSMVLLNKIALSQYPLQSPTALLLVQCALCALLAQLLRGLRVVEVQHISWPIVKMWLPCNIVFVMMLFSSFMALKFLSVPMLTTLKNLSNLFTIVGDRIFYDRHYNWGVWMTLLLMAISAGVGAKTDLEFNLWGYVWQLINCACTAGYSLYMRGVMDRVKPLTQHKGPLSEVTMVVLNNSLCIPPLIALMICTGELQYAFLDPVWGDPGFLIAALLSSLVSFGISFASLWFLSTSTPTTYSLVGSLNKVPIAVLSLMLFKDRNLHNPHNLGSVGIGLLAGVVFVMAKMRPGPAPAAQQATKC